jgi:cobalt-zinc-cadmium resistance protein CzcA
MIVDGSIVMVENTLRRLNESRQSMPDRLSVVLASVREMARPILFGMLIITVVYIPVLSLQGLEYKLFSPMVFTVCLALFGALVASLVLVPVLCSFFLKPAAQESDNFVLKATRPVYQRLLASAMAAPRRTMGIALALFLLTLASVPFLGTEFVPELDEGDLIVEVRNFPSISLSESTAVSTRVERALRTFPEVKTVVSKTGRPDLATDPMGVYQTDTYVILKPRHQWRRGIDKEELVEEMSQRLNRQVAGAHFNFTQPIAMRVDELVSGVRSDLAIKIFGPDFVELSRLADEIQKVLQTVPGQTDLQVEKLSGAAQWVIYPDRVRMARYGVTMQDIQEVVETAVLGHAVSEVLEGNKRFALRVKLAEESTGPVTSLDDLLIETTGGPRIPLAQIAQVRQEEGLELIQREQGQRRMMVQCNVRGRDIGSFVRDSQALIAKAVTLPPGYTLHWSGQFENQQRAMAKLAVVVPGAIAVIFLLLWATFNSVRYALLVLLNVPFALIGGILALWLRGMYLSVPAMVGLIALFGVAVLNGLVLVSTINQLREEQQLPLEEAIAQAAATRLRPVLMTAMVAALGFFPMALSAGAGAEVQKPLATVVIGGLFSSTLLTLLVIPVVYAWVHRRESLRHTDVILR